MSVKVIDQSHTHMPDEAIYPDYNGLTVRQALRQIRKEGQASFGDMGGLTLYMSDHSYIEVNLYPATGGGYVLSSQQIERWWQHEPGDGCYRVYRW